VGQERLDLLEPLILAVEVEAVRVAGVMAAMVDLVYAL